MKDNKNLLVIGSFILLSYLIYSIDVLFILKSFFGWFETFFHEISHGLASVFTGGSIDRIELKWNGSGVCYTMGGIKSLTTFSGYFGASIWGSFIYLLTSHKNKNVNIFSIIGILLFMFIIMFYAGNFATIIIITTMMILLGTIWYFREKPWSKYVSQFIGIYIIFNSLFSPTYLFYYTDTGDHVSMFNHTGISPTFWIYLWVVLCSLVMIGTIYISSKRKNK